MTSRSIRRLSLRAAALTVAATAILGATGLTASAASTPPAGSSTPASAPPAPVAVATRAPDAAVATPAPGAAAATPEPAASAAPPDPALAVKVADWVTGGGEADLQRLGTDFKQLEQAANDNDMGAIGASCSTLSADVEKAQAYDPIPDTTAQKHWAAALDQYAHGAADCVAGAAAADANLITQASEEITTGSGELAKVTQRLNEIAG